MSVTTEPTKQGNQTEIRSVHEFCLVCGSRNGHGLNLSFFGGDDGWVQATLNGTEHLQGYPRMMHGGVISLLLDAAMTHCLFAQGCAGVTAKLEIKFRHPVTVDSPVTVRARLVHSSPPGHQLVAELLQEKIVKATACGLFVVRPKLARYDSSS